MVVTFEEVKAREEVLSKAAMLRGSNIYITEDLSRFEQLRLSGSTFSEQDNERHEERVAEVHEGRQETEPRGERCAEV